MTIIAIMAFMTLYYLIFQSADVYAKTAKEIDASVDVALENFQKQVNGGKEFLKSAKGVFWFSAQRAEENYHSGFYARSGP